MIRILAALALAVLGAAGCTTAGSADAPAAAPATATPDAEGGLPDADVPPPGPGARTNPIPVGTAANAGPWKVSFADTNTNANGIVAAENQFNEQPAPGRQYVMATVHLQYGGTEPATPWIDLAITFVGSKGNTFDVGDDCGVIPNALTDVGEMHFNAEGSGAVCYSVETDQVEGGSWAVERTLDFNDQPKFFALH